MIPKRRRWIPEDYSPAVQAAEGEWVMFMDDDNFAKPHEVSTFIRAAARSGGEVRPVRSVREGEVDKIGGGAGSLVLIRTCICFRAIQVLTCFNDYLPDGASAPDSKTVPSGRYVPLGPSSTASVFRNSIGDANAMFKRHVLVVFPSPPFTQGV